MYLPGETGCWWLVTSQQLLPVVSLMSQLVCSRHCLTWLALILAVTPRYVRFLIASGGDWWWPAQGSPQLSIVASTGAALPARAIKSCCTISSSTLQCWQLSEDTAPMLGSCWGARRTRRSLLGGCGPCYRQPASTAALVRGIASRQLLSSTAAAPPPITTGTTFTSILEIFLVEVTKIKITAMLVSVHQGWQGGVNHWSKVDKTAWPKLVKGASKWPKVAKSS